MTVLYHCYRLFSLLNDVNLVARASSFDVNVFSNTVTRNSMNSVFGKCYLFL